MTRASWLAPIVVALLAYAAGTNLVFAQGDTIYVSKAGRNAAPFRTRESASSTIAGACAAAKPGDSILIVDSETYEEHDLVVPEGRPNAPITLAGAPGERPVIFNTAAANPGQTIPTITLRPFTVLENVLVTSFEREWWGNGRAGVIASGHHVRVSNVIVHNFQWGGIDCGIGSAWATEIVDCLAFNCGNAMAFNGGGEGCPSKDPATAVAFRGCVMDGRNTSLYVGNAGYVLASNTLFVSHNPFLTTHLPDLHLITFIMNGCLLPGKLDWRAASGGKDSSANRSGGPAQFINRPDRGLAVALWCGPDLLTADVAAGGEIALQVFSFRRGAGEPVISLADAVPFVPPTGWVRLPVVRKEGSRWVAALPAGIAGPHVVRAAIAGEAFDFDISVIDPAAKLALGIFIDRNRSVFRQNETAPVTVAARPGGKPGKGTLVMSLREAGAADAEQIVLWQQTADFDSPDSFTFQIYASALRPGRYWLTALAVLADGARVKSRRCPIEIVNEQPDTSFRIYRDQPAGGFGEAPIERGYDSVEQAIDDMADAGFNLIFDQLLSLSPDTSPVEAPLDAPLGYFPEEQYQPTREERIMEEAMRRGCDVGFLIGQMGFYPFTPANPHNPVAVAVDSEYRDRTLKTVATVTQVVGRFANFFGYNFGHDQATTGRYWSEPEEQWKRIHDAMVAAYRKEFGADPQEDPGRDPRDYWKWKKFVEYDCVETGLTYLAHAAKHPGFGRCGTHQATGDAACQNHFAPAYSKELDFAFGYATSELNNSPLGRAAWVTDCSRAARLDMPAFTTLRNWGRDHLTSQRRDLLLAIALGSDGVGLGDWGGPAFLPDQHNLPPNYIKPFFDLLKRNGDLFTKLEPAADVAILASYPEQVLGQKKIGLGWWYGDPGQIDATYWAYLYTLFAGHVPRIVTEENIIINDDLTEHGFRALLLPRIGGNSLTEYGGVLVKRIMEFVKSGGCVIADAATTLDIPGAERLPYVMQNSPGDANAGALPDFALHGQCRPEVEQLKAILDRRCSLPSEANRYGVFVIPQRSLRPQRSGRPQRSPQPQRSRGNPNSPTALFVINCTRPPLGTCNVRTAPVTCEISINDPAVTAVYDVFEDGEVQIREKGGKRVFTADLTRIEGKLYSLLPARPERLRVACMESYQRLELGAAIADAKGTAVPADLPLEVTVNEPGGSQRYHAFRAIQGGTMEMKIPLASNERPGNWTCTIREPVTGFTATVRSPVKANVDRTILEPEPDVRMTKAAETFLQRDEQECRLVLQTPAQDDLEPLAQRVSAALANNGLACTVLKAARAEDVAIDTNGCNFLGPYPRVDGLLVLMGRPDDNFLLKHVAERNLLPRRFSQYSPGPGRAYVDVVTGPFQGSTDVLVIVAADKRGIEAAVKLLEGYSVPPRKPIYGGSDPSILTKPGWSTSTERKPQVAPAIAGPPVSSLAVSPDGSLIVAGRTSWGDNLFGISASGGIEWKTHAACCSPERIQVGRQGVLLGSSLLRHREWYTDEGLQWETAPAVFPYLEPEEELACIDLKGRTAWRLPNWKDAVLLPDGSAFYGGWQMVAHVDADGRVLFSHDEWQQYFTQRHRPWNIVASADGSLVAYLMGTGSANQGFQPKRVVLYDAANRRILFDRTIDGLPGREPTFLNREPQRLLGFAGREIVLFDGAKLTYFNAAGEQAYQSPPVDAGSVVLLRQGQARPDNRVLLVRGAGFACVDGSGKRLWQGRLSDPGLWQDRMPDPGQIVEVREWGEKLVARDERGSLWCIGADGSVLWKADVRNVTAFAAARGALFAGTDDGRVCTIDARGTMGREVRLDGQLLPMGADARIDGRSGLPRPTGTKVDSQRPAAGRENLARRAKASLELLGSGRKWSSDATFLVDGRIEERTELRYPRERYSFMGGLANGGMVLPAVATLEWEQPVTISVIGIHDGKHDKPYTVHGLLFQPNPVMARWLGTAVPQHSAIEFRIDAEVNGAWLPLAQVRDNLLPWHVHTFNPVTTTKIRYTVTVTGDGEFWCEEIQAYK
ncbi:MAG TPA: hypothetical protein VM186_08065 [Planctomycetota bacterium]|nr:hypothetical protein [Planctomycetota bacterium]